MKIEFFSKYFQKNTQKLNFLKIRPVETEEFHADGRTDMTNLVVAFRNFRYAPKKSFQVHSVNSIWFQNNNTPISEVYFIRQHTGCEIQ